jgi:hypothetical protein
MMLPTKPNDVMRVTVALEINDPGAVYDAARELALENGNSEEDVVDMLGTAAEPNLSACCQWIIDPGVSPAGTSILYSEVDNA